MISGTHFEIKSTPGSGNQLITGIEEFIINFIVPLVVVASSFGIFSLYISPTHKKLPELRNDITTKTSEVQVLQGKVDQLTALERNKSMLIDDLQKMSWALEERDKVPELTEQVRVMSEEAKVQFKSLDYSNTNTSEVGRVVTPTASLTPDPNLYKEEKVNVSISMPGTPETIAFLKTTENSIRLFKVETLRISKQGDAASTASMTMASPYLNPTFSTYSETAAPINLTDPAYRQFMNRLDEFKNYAKDIDATLPKI